MLSGLNMAKRLRKNLLFSFQGQSPVLHPDDGRLFRLIHRCKKKERRLSTKIHFFMPQYDGFELYYYLLRMECLCSLYYRCIHHPDISFPSSIKKEA